ncbi:NADase-type glycan-binding domain-containing protein [Paucidesulfovibrio gracilis]|nr:hypothetical protein [Paucidesulfovibrio gracilis]
MKRYALSAVLLLGVFSMGLWSAPTVHALEMTVSSSSTALNLLEDFGPENLVDNDPATAWAEGVTGDGRGEWVLFEFGRAVRLERLGIRNGWQDEGEYGDNSRPGELELEFSDGSTMRMPLADESGWQYLEMDRPTRWVRLTLASVVAGRTRPDRTCLSDVSFELTLLDDEAVPDGSAVAPASGPDTGQQADEAPTSDDEAVAGSDEAVSSTGNPSGASVHDAAKAGSGAAQDAAGSAEGAQAASEDAAVLAEEPSGSEETVQAQLPPDQEAWEELPEVDVQAMAGEREAKGGKVAGPEDQQAVREAIRAYYTKLVTLDDEYLELYSEKVREEEAFMFEYFKELQRQRRVYHLFRKALVDTEELRFGPALLDGTRLRLEVQGRCTLYVADTYEDMSVHTRFTFVKEQDRWRILEAEELETPEEEAAGS